MEHLRNSLIVAFGAVAVFCGGAFAAPEKAHAVWGIGDVVVEVGYNFIKEQGLDSIVWGLINEIINQMSNEIVAWINNGFEGSPAFVSNPERFFARVGDRVAGEFLRDLANAYNPAFGAILCEDTDLQIRLALEYYYYQREADLEDRYACRLSDIQRNVGNGIIDVDILSLSRGESSLKRYLELQTELQVRLGREELTQRQVLDWGSGFLSFRQCRDGETQPNCTGPIRNPGTIVETQLNEWLGLPAGRLQVADEVSEIIGALLGQLVQRVFGATGLAGDYEELPDGGTRSGTIENINDLVDLANRAIGDITRYRQSIAQKRDLLAEIILLANTALTTCPNLGENDQQILRNALRDVEGLANRFNQEEDRMDDYAAEVERILNGANDPDSGVPLFQWGIRMRGLYESEGQWLRGLIDRDRTEERNVSTGSLRALTNLLNALLPYRNCGSTTTDT